MVIIEKCPSLLVSGYKKYSPKALRTLFYGKNVSPLLDFSLDEDSLNVDEAQQNMKNISISGAQEKLSAVIDGGKIRLSYDGEQGTHILKPAPVDIISERKQIPMNEHLTMQIANQVYGIDTAANGLCFDVGGHPVYITKRFDIAPDGTKYHQEDFCSLIGKTESNGGSEFKYDGSYLDIANAIRKYVPAWQIAMEHFFKLVVFNYIYANGDAHLKNFSVLDNGNEMKLAPAYDLINTMVHINGTDFGLKFGFSETFDKSDTYHRTGHPCKEDFYNFGLSIGIVEARVNKIISQFTVMPSLTLNLIENSFFFNDSTKRNYKRIITERIARFNRN
ncbi:MAG: HipA domain-containing protein [Paludibacteraceae bacterium]|nr:HipA domain-containing protein [Paludibacteraceae bacterium]